MALLPVNTSVGAAGSSSASIADLETVESESVVDLDVTPQVKRPCTSMEEPELSSTSTSASDVSPGKLKSMARRMLVLPPVISQPFLPELSSVTGRAFLAWHAGDLVERGKVEDRRKRCLRKGRLPLDQVLLRIAAEPDADVSCGACCWSNRQKAGHAAAALFSEAYSLTVREARKSWAPVWARAPATVKNNWVFSFASEGYDEMRKKLSLPANLTTVDEAAEGVSVGALLTWQSSLGRCRDCVAEWVGMGISVDTTAELMQGNEYCKQRFARFCSTVLAYVSQHGFKNASCSMELNPSRKEAVVHFHDYVCADWEQWKGAKRATGVCLKDDWAFDGFTPTVKFTNVRRNACPKKVMSGGLYYCYVAKIGSVFQFCTLTPGKDCSLTACLPAPTQIGRD